MGIALTPEEQFEIFGTDKLGEHTEEARQRWGESDAWKQSQRRATTRSSRDSRAMPARRSSPTPIAARTSRAACAAALAVPR